MLIAIFAFLAMTFGGGPEGGMPQDFNKQVKKKMTDEVRKDQILDLNKQIREGVKASNKRLKTLSKDVRALTPKYDSTADEIQTIVDQYFVERRETQETMIDARLKMKDLITREEWGAIF